MPDLLLSLPNRLLSEMEVVVMVRIGAALGIALLLLLQACTHVEPHEKEKLSGRLMQIEDNELETGYQNKVLFSREVSGGKPGHAAGGGCGCGN